MKTINQETIKGFYAHIRHPQYVGIWLIMVGFLIQWVTLIALAMWLVLMIAYYRLSMCEERELSKKFESEFKAYKNRVPAFIPHKKNKRENPTVMYWPD